MELIKIVGTSVGSIVILFFLAKIMGNREISELSMFDYISSITIGAIAGEMAISPDDYIKPMVSMIIIGFISFAISYITCKSIILRRFFEGQSLLLYQDGKIYEKNLLKAKLDVSEFLEMCRVEGYFDLEDVHTIFLEANGKISILPAAKSRPVTLCDLNLPQIQNLPLANVIIDGKLLKDNLKSTGKNEQWLNEQLTYYGIANMNEVMLATIDITNEKLNLYMKLHHPMTRDIYE